MPAIALRDDFDAASLRELAKRSRDVRQTRRLLALAAVYDGMSRAEAPLGAAALLIGLIGGRVTPSFTRNWMARAGLEPLPVAFGRFDQTVLLASAAALSAWVLWPQTSLTGLGLLAVGALHAVRLARWRGLKTGREPIVLVLHLGYLWLALSLALMGLAALAPHLVSASTALYALSAGAIGTMTLAVMTRASLGHTGRVIASGAAINTIYLLVSLGAVLRLAAPYLADWQMAATALSAVAWSGAFALFVAAYGPILVKPGNGRL